MSAQKESISMTDQRTRAAVITPAMPLDRVLTAMRHCTERDLRAMFAHCQQRADEATEAGYVGAGALFAALADLVMLEQYDREQAGRAIDGALKGWNHNSDVALRNRGHDGRMSRVRHSGS